jgi:protein TonB
MKKLFHSFFLFFIAFCFGQPKYKQIKNDSIQVIVCTAPSDDMNNLNEDAIYNVLGVEVKPIFPGGWIKLDEFVKMNYQVPLINGQKIKGKISTTVIIEKDGNISNISIIKDLGYGSGKEAERVLMMMPKWTPAMVNGKPVKCLYTIPIQLP